MAGIYLHIPFCASRCIYCDFYSTVTRRERMEAFVEALCGEMEERKGLLQGEVIRTLYFGGGTPSLLGAALTEKILRQAASCFDLSECEEVTLEANPEDVMNEELWPALTEVNRVSMGVQSMVDSELQLLGRRHDAQRVREAVHRLRTLGIGNISLDLMYGLPRQTMESWAYSIEQLLALHPQHISAYNLSVEEGTRLYRKVQRGELVPADDETCLAMASLLRQRLREAGYQQYEISNYALPGFHSRHNSSYWVQTPYLGLGPGAHSYDGQCLRSWNATDLGQYIAGNRQEEHEHLSPTDRYNERLMLGLRTARGVDLNELTLDGEQPDISDKLSELQSRHLVHIDHNRMILTEEGLALCDEVIRELFI